MKTALMTRMWIASAAFASGLLISVTGSAVAQTAKDLVGTWTCVSDVNIRPDGSRTDIFGPHLKGMAIFDGNGRFAYVNIDPDVPKFAASRRTQGTVEENKAAVLGGIALFGTYSVAEKVIFFHVEGSTYPNWTGTDQQRKVVSYTGDEFKWAVSSSVGGTGEVTWKRIK